VKAVFEGLAQLKTPEAVAALRGLDLGMTEIQTKIERGKRFMPTAPKGEKKKGPVNTIGEERKGRGGPRRGGRRGAEGADKAGGAPEAPKAAE